MFVIFVVIALSTLALQTDPSVEKNPGPSQEKNPGPSQDSSYFTLRPDEKMAYNKIAKLNSTIATTYSHRQFLLTCMAKEVIPVGYKSKQSVVTASQTEELLSKHGQLNEEHIQARMHTDIQHYNAILPTQVTDRNILLKKLEDTCCSEEQFQELSANLETKYNTELEFLQKTKVKKMTSLLTKLQNNKSREWWIPSLYLTNEDKQTIVENQPICDQVINSAMSCLMKSKPYLAIQPTTFGERFLTYCSTETIHIHHTGSFHFVTSSSIGRTINVYDSLNTSPTTALMKQVTALYSHDDSPPQTFLLPMKQQQEGSTDCGIFSIAYAVDLAFGNNPSNIVYDQSGMRNHLTHCLESKLITPFPRFKYTHPATRVEATSHIDSTNKWSTPTRSISPSRLPPIAQNNPPITTYNHYSPLAVNQETPKSKGAMRDKSTPNSSTSARSASHLSTPAQIPNGQDTCLASRVATGQDTGATARVPASHDAEVTTQMPASHDAGEADRMPISHDAGATTQTPASHDAAAATWAPANKDAGAADRTDASHDASTAASVSHDAYSAAQTPAKHNASEVYQSSAIRDAGVAERMAVSQEAGATDRTAASQDAGAIDQTTVSHDAAGAAEQTFVIQDAGATDRTASSHDAPDRTASSQDVGPTNRKPASHDADAAVPTPTPTPTSPARQYACATDRAATASQDVGAATRTPASQYSGTSTRAPTSQHVNSNRKSTLQKKSRPTQQKLGLPAHELQRRLQNKKSSVVNLCRTRNLSNDERSVLELGLSYCPSVQHYNKEQLADDVYQFIRQLKLKEYFHSEEDQYETRPEDEDPDRTESKWKQKNSGWYPDAVRNNRSESLNSFITQFLAGVRQNLRNNNAKFANNLTETQRAALKKLAMDKSIIIKPSDKCGSVVVMDVDAYDSACLEQLEDTSFYKESARDPNPDYKEEVMEEIRKLRGDDLITDAEFAMLSQGAKTPAFYGLPKLHSVKPLDVFPPLRPICSGSESCTKRLSEFLDTFLKAAARKLPSYIQDTTSFVKKIKNFIPSVPTSDIHLAVLDVNALYPNIDQVEGANACYEQLENRRDKTFSSALLKKLISLVLRCNALIFNNRFFQQISGTAMGTPMAVNFANIFMGKFEHDMLAEYERTHRMKPKMWVRFIDDIFIVWEGKQEDLKQFLDFANNYAEKAGYASSIKFKFMYGKAVDFLDTTIYIQPNGQLGTTLYAKPTASYNYLHHNSYHVSHVKNSLPKSQFLRIRRICSTLADYDMHASKFVQYFVKRNYNQEYVKQKSDEVRAMKREDILEYRTRNVEASAKRIPLVITHHHKFTGISKVLQNCFKRVTSQSKEFTKVFPQPPLVAYRRANNLKDRLVRANHHKVKKDTAIRSSTKSFIDNQMNDSGSITNAISGRSCKIPGGSANTRGCIYAAECKKHSLLYVGETGGPLNVRFNGHRSDMNLRPDRCELDAHFASNDCDMANDMLISVLETIPGSTETYRKYKEDKWITRLDSIKPKGLNVSSHDFGYVYKTLFRP